MDKLRQFYADKAMMSQWASFVKEKLDDEALNRVYTGKDTTAVKEARDIINKSFSALEAHFEPKKQKSTDKAI